VYHKPFLIPFSKLFPLVHAGRRIPIALPNTGALSRRRHTLYIRSAIIVFILFAFLQFHVINYDSNESGPADTANYSTAAILQMVPPVFHKYLTSKTRNGTQVQNGTHTGPGDSAQRAANISEILRMINRYNELQTILNEDIFGPLQNDSVIIVVQVSTSSVRVTTRLRLRGISVAGLAISR
ncbi:uncharacterized protein LOC110680498, partial [Aedes aegypti]|uniref:Uncharacterized protein n=1 Tax=Aedes aegypti TaxID=7159 RepID=A0A903VTG1_AEDAE